MAKQPVGSYVDSSTTKGVTDPVSVTEPVADPVSEPAGTVAALEVPVAECVASPDEGPASVEGFPSTLTPVCVTFTDNAHASAAESLGVAIVIYLPLLSMAHQVCNWCLCCLWFIDRDLSAVSLDVVCSFGNYASCCVCIYNGWFHARFMVGAGDTIFIGDESYL